MTEEVGIQSTVKEKQPELVEHFAKVIAAHKLAHAYLFAGESGIGKDELATWIAMRLFCLNVQNDMPCGKCQECRRISTNQHPDVIVVKPDGQSIKVDQVRFLKSEFTKSAVEGNQKIFIISDADKMTSGAANSLLKFIEEPSPNVTAFLLTTNKNLMLPTIISRTEVVELKPLVPAQFKAQLQGKGITPSLIAMTMNLTNSAVEVENWLADDWLTLVQSAVSRWFLLVFQKDMRAFVEVQAKITGLAKTKENQQLILDIVMLYCREALILKVNPKNSRLSFPNQDAQIEKGLTQKSENSLMAATEQALQAKNLLNRNVSFQNVLEALTIKLCRVY
ncbi:DNA polymerase III delta prime subunit [Pediococcus damnosus]|uniref:DNA polymerase III delta prime subunit n=1 Tax=Pediococcus damnosus TaxID=51663 RepID=A0A0R2HBI4_9LACO|nr:DNA polymerase III subunit delta' [Pediococcus damnosus]AMV60068.1 DNA polymerase III delta prime subunit [Pediococcus damnosus]AMV62608.1 DNA polymerase III delta prime subunit [Pediococcus damnosus]AMV64313.1 DNA polymerase III delta prime subunit [Pediococcus damnosus]AMV67513.1 DNA polymerase III delta prime subunit [Pediococcus damnosus]AMV69135.1 DNA polymerase III delta prime subunit [Pediococcus damnosus]